MIAGLVASLSRLVAGANVRWVDVPRRTGPKVYFANHSSHLDTLVLWAALPRELRDSTRPVAARDYWGATGARRWLAESVFRAVLIER
jgi:1-acyl-sn-glycerol-3-phosphate acyltransferase